MRDAMQKRLRGWASRREALYLLVAMAWVGQAAAMEPIPVRDDNLRLPSAWKACSASAECVRIPNGCGETSVSAQHEKAARAHSYAIAGNPAQLNCSAPSKSVWSGAVCLSGSCTLVFSPPPPPSLSFSEARAFLARSAEYEACRVDDDCTVAANECGAPRPVNRRYLEQYETAARISGTAVSCVVTKRWTKGGAREAVGCVASRCVISNPSALYPTP